MPIPHDRSQHTNFVSRLLGTLAAIICSSAALANAAVDFEREVRPLLAKHCVSCHGTEKQKGGLRLDHKADAFKAGDSGEVAIVPGHAELSPFIKLLENPDKTERMPLKEPPLAAKEIALLKQWIAEGAVWPDEPASRSAGKREMTVTDKDREHWAFRGIANITPPRGEHPVDAFIFAALEAQKLGLSPQVDRQREIRRVYFDLVGLPPTPEAVAAYVADASPEAYERLVEKLLASPEYGERWGRHWLDVVRYADSNGQEGDQDRLTAHHYRDFVIRALNDDMPYDQFVCWQLAGGELEPDNPSAVAATGFIVAGPHTVLNVPMEEEKVRNRFNELDDMISTTGSAFLGLTIACARCHDHKYDAIPTRDYYQMLGAFNSGDRAEIPLVPHAKVAEHEAAMRAWKAEHETAKKRFDDWLAKIKAQHTPALRAARIAGLPISDADKSALRDEPQSARAKELQRKHDKALKLADDDFRKAFSSEQVAEWDALAKQVAAIEAKKPAPLPTALAMADFGAEPRETWLFDRGEFTAKKERVELGFLTVLSRGKTAQDYLASARREKPLTNTTYQRKAMAEWITDLEHGPGALLARVMVNRVWQHHFGEGLVRTVNDFGVQGEAPSHPELLEWLAAEFIRGGWKLKSLHRLIMTSATYRQDTKWDAAKAKADPDNRLLGWRRPLRIESEILRDSILAVSGQLNPARFGPAVRLPIQAEAILARNLKDPYPKDIKESAETKRRTIYTFHKRVVPYPLLQAFDGPDASGSCGRRINTTVAPQALALLNDATIRRRAVDFAERLVRETGDETVGCVERGYRLALGRPPSLRESETAVRFVETQLKHRAERDKATAADARREALADYCQALFNLNEFIYVD